MLTVGLIINYMDSISKNLALSCAIVLTACLDHAWFNGPMTLNIISAAGIVHPLDLHIRIRRQQLEGVANGCGALLIVNVRETSQLIRDM